MRSIIACTIVLLWTCTCSASDPVQTLTHCDNLVGGRFGLSIQRIGKLGEVDRGQRDERQNEGRSECDAGFMPGQILLHHVV